MYVLNKVKTSIKELHEIILPNTAVATGETRGSKREWSTANN